MIWEAHYSWVAWNFEDEKTVSILKKYFYWLNLWQDVGKYIRSCIACAISKLTIKNQGLYTPYLPLVNLGNPSPWIACWDFLLLSMEMAVFSWSSKNSRRWRLWRPARRISQQKPLLNSYLNECGCTLGSHSLSYQIRIAGSSTHFDPASGQCWIPAHQVQAFHPQTYG